MAQRLTHKQFLLDVPKILEGTMEPTQEHYNIFMKRVTRGWELANEQGYYNDSEDYHAWGHALYDDVDVEAEDEGSEFFELTEKFQDNE
jgi:hypothetical protein